MLLLGSLICKVMVMRIGAAAPSQVAEHATVGVPTRLRATLVSGATAYLRHIRSGRITPSPWLAGLLQRKPPKLVAVALANKTARMIWAIMTSGEAYREPELRAA